MVNQVLGDFEAREPRMIRYLEVVKTLLQDMPGATLQYVPREENAQADALSRVVTADFPHLVRQVMIEILEKPSVEEVHQSAMPIMGTFGWMKPICDYLTSRTLPEDPAEARRIAFRSNKYTLDEDGNLYR